MTKGLRRSIARAPAQARLLEKRDIRVDLTLTPTGSTGAVVFETAVIGDFPQGNILLLGAVAYLSFAGPGSSANLVDTWAGDYSVGTVATANNDLADAGEADIIASTAIGDAVAEVIAPTRGVFPNTSGAISPLILDNTDGSLEMNLNVLFDADDVTNGETVNIRTRGVLHVAYMILGDD